MTLLIRKPINMWQEIQKRQAEAIASYQLKNLLLAYPSDWFIDPALLNAAKESLPVLTGFFKGNGTADLKPVALGELIREPLKEVYTIPFLSEKFCRLLMDEIQNFNGSIHFLPNDAEDALRQIPEVVLHEHLPVLHNALMEVAHNVLNPIFMHLWQRRFAHGNIQIANYNLRDKAQGAWHHDASADISVVVPLNTGQYEGGGTEFLNRGIVEPLPSGNALIFPAFTHMHRGLPVISGDRYLLVFWLKDEGDCHAEN